MKKWIILCVLLCAAGIFVFSPDVPGWKRPEGVSLSRSYQIRSELHQALTLEGDRDAREDQLADLGFTVEDSDPVYPAYLIHTDPLRSYASGDQDSFSVFQVREDNRVFHLFFEADLLVLTTLTDGVVTDQEIRPLYEWELTASDVFYYRCYPSDPHYIDYGSFRLNPPDHTLFDMTRTYILPIGYQMVNLFLTNWQEGNWADVCLNDTFEYLYAVETGQEFPWQSLTPRQDSGWYEIDADLFEEMLLPYFALDRQELRAMCRYDPDTHTYPWRPAEGNEIIGKGFAFHQPEIIASEARADGTLALTVRVSCSDQKRDNRFTHQVLVRPTSKGFQYAGNQVTFVSDSGLPLSKSRFDLLAS